MTKKHTYSLFAVAPIGGEWKKLDHFPLAICFDFYPSDEEAINGLRKTALENLCHNICAYDGMPFMPVDLESRTYMICDETSDKTLSVFTLEVRLKEEKL